MTWKIWVGTILNFFLLGLGYLLFTPKKIMGAFLTVGAVLATYVEQVPLKGLEDKTPFLIMFVAFFCLALGCAIDGYQEIKKAQSSAS
jgi:hypothetical protein